MAIKSKYLGPTQHRRVITVADQIKLGSTKTAAEAQGDLVWEARNGHLVDVTEAHESVIQFLKDSPSFETGTKVNVYTKAKSTGTEDDDSDAGKDTAPKSSIATTPPSTSVTTR